MPEIHLLEIQKPYPEWVELDLKGIFNPSEKTFSLFLGLTYQEQWRSLLDGRVKLALKAGIFKLKLSTGEFIPFSEQRDDIALIGKEDTQRFAWQLFPPRGKSFLDQVNPEIPLGKVILKDQPCDVTGTWEISPADLSVTDAENLWRHDLSPNKHGILERVLARFLVQQASTEKLGKLQRIIDQIYEANTQNLAELAQIAELNLKKDLAGGNFLGAVLSGVELNSADLSRVNFRGAILTDADLSEANLSHANFSGADLSGAYLESANLQYTDFHKASLALVNLIGTNLSHANLTQTNITNANLSSATLTQTLFGDNAGMTDTLKENLQQRGAKFIPDRD
ncbi:MAG: pentapeptide repeat-containing protein [Snowella sp.]